MEQYSPLSDSSRTWIATQVCEPAPIPDDAILYADQLLESLGCLPGDDVNLCGVWKPREVGTCCGFPISQMGPYHPDHETALSFLENSRRSPSPPNLYTTGPWAINMDCTISNAAFRVGPWGPTISTETETIEPSVKE